MRSYVSLIEEVALHLVLMLDARGTTPYEALDTSAMPVREAKRRGEGWLVGYADIAGGLTAWDGMRGLGCSSPSTRRGRDHRFRFRLCQHTKDQPLAESFFALRARPDPRLVSVGASAPGPYVVDKGFEGEDNHRRWLDRYGAQIICPPKRNVRKRSWSKRLRRWVASIRQIIETVYEKLHNTFGLRRERPHDISGLRARLAARVALHNFCMWLNEQLGRPRLGFADLLGW